MIRNKAKTNTCSFVIDPLAIMDQTIFCAFCSSLMNFRMFTAAMEFITLLNKKLYDIELINLV